MKNLEKLLTTKVKAIRVIYISSYIPRFCGIATYTKDLTNAINLLNPYAQAEIMVLNREADKLEYPWEAKFKIEQDNSYSVKDNSLSNLISKSKSTYWLLLSNLRKFL